MSKAILFDARRRQLLKRALYGASGVGLRSLATGLPISFLLGRQPRAAAQTAAVGLAPQFLVFSTSGDGDPISCNVPGTYVSGASHSANPTMAPTQVNFGGTASTAALPWATFLSSAPGISDRTTFFHHATLTVDHSAAANVCRLLGGTQENIQLQEIFASYLGKPLETVQTAPITFNTYGSELCSFQGRTLAALSPIGLKTILAPPQGPLVDLVKLRDSQLDAISAYLRTHGTTQQKQALDLLALSQKQVRSLSDSLISSLEGIADNSNASQLTAAIIMIQMKVTSVVQIHLHVAGDNHFDTQAGEVFAAERQDHNTLLGGDPAIHNGVGDLTRFCQGLKTAGLEDRVTFASYNVFGRGLVEVKGGREHAFTHSCGVVMGKHVKPGIIGGIVPTPDGSQFQATPIDASTGLAALGGGDVPYEQTMASFGKTLGTLVGLPQATTDAAILSGKTIAAAIATS